ncbi:MAG: carbamoyltransferase HypF, partial [Promethearchaeota archaeon]
SSEDFQTMITALQAGKIVALKGIGGVNLICRGDQIEVIDKIRNRKRDRKYKPFAVMMPNLETARQYCAIDSMTQALLTSYRRPIVLCPKKPGTLPENIAPGLPNVGVVLPYMGIHYLLFHHLGNIPLVFTSGNVSSLPMGIDNDIILQQLSPLADLFYLHTREIYQRCDDSVIRPVLGKPALIRRSRGYVPEYIKLPFSSPAQASLAVGAELNSTGAVARGDRIFPTQHIGNVRNLDTYDFLEHSIVHMQTLLKISDAEIGFIVRDAHPSFQSTQLAQQLSQRLNDIPIIPVYHHHAHLASLMVDHKLPLSEEIIVITIDGVGYGKDKQSWGGEVLRGGYSEFTRIGHLQPTPMIGGDLVAKNPARMLVCALMSSTQYAAHSDMLDRFITSRQLWDHFPHGKTELDLVEKLLRNSASVSRKAYPLSTSFGRWLDAAASLFDVCQLRTYRGEPAMRLEGFMWDVKEDLEKLSPPRDLDQYLAGNTILSNDLLWDYFIKVMDSSASLNSHTARVLAYSLVVDLSQLFARVAITHAHKAGIHKIGVSGGVAYNEIIMRVLRTEIEKSGFNFLQHERVPPGDAGISIGQLAVGNAWNLSLKVSNSKL